jgi:hypothetical protein
MRRRATPDIAQPRCPLSPVSGTEGVPWEEAGVVVVSSVLTCSVRPRRDRTRCGSVIRVWLRPVAFKDARGEHDERVGERGCDLLSERGTREVDLGDVAGEDFLPVDLLTANGGRRYGAPKHPARAAVHTRSIAPESSRLSQLAKSCRCVLERPIVWHSQRSLEQWRRLRSTLHPRSPVRRRRENHPAEEPPTALTPGCNLGPEAQASERTGTELWSVLRLSNFRHIG